MDFLSTLIVLTRIVAPNGSCSAHGPTLTAGVSIISSLLLGGLWLKLVTLTTITALLVKVVCPQL